jgi:hypothetical protein
VRPAALVVVLALVLTGCGDDGGGEEPAPPSVPESRGTSVYELQLGDCVTGLDQGRDLRVRTVPCRRRHQAEVYGIVPITGQRFPGVEFVRREAATRCAQAFADYTGSPAGPGNDVAFTEVVPTLESWAAGDRESLCLVLGAGGGTLRGSLAAP